MTSTLPTKAEKRCLTEHLAVVGRIVQYPFSREQRLIGLTLLLPRLGHDAPTCPLPPPGIVRVFPGLQLEGACLKLRSDSIIRFAATVSGMDACGQRDRPD